MNIDNRPVSVKLGITGCMNCNATDCKDGSRYKKSPDSDHCENRIFDGDEDLYDYINSQYY